MEFFPLKQSALIRPEDFLALEEALLDFCETSDHPGFLTFWEPTTYFVVLGYGKQLEKEVYSDTCAQLEIPVFRRTSGGGTVLQGPGCLNYTLILPLAYAAELETITGANRFIMGSVRDAFATLLPGTVAVQGHTDLTLDGLKFCGNAQRRKRRCLLFHGSILHHFDLDLVSRTLRMPAQQPDYRLNRTHDQFITNCQLEPASIESALCSRWKASSHCKSDTANKVISLSKALALSKYSQDEWNRRL